MRLLVQRVTEARVAIDNQVAGQIGKGLMVLAGFHRDDSELDIPWFVSKLVNLRIFGDGEGKMNLSVKEIQGSILVVSQFTLYANIQGGRRPDFFQSAPPSQAIPLYERFLELLRRECPVETGRFGAMMQISLVNDGPVTILIEKEKRTANGHTNL
jgi:D-tyrosyl-tRNA(Tyr) deacylase